MMRPRSRKAVLAAHVICSVGWLGAVLAFLALAIAAMSSPDAQLVRSVYVAMEMIAQLVLIPMSLLSLLSGLVLSLGTKWGLFRHYWVLITLFINVSASIILFLFMQELGPLASLARSFDSDLGELRSPVPSVHAAAALLLLLLAATLSVYKPRGMTRYGQRRVRQRRLS